MRPNTRFQSIVETGEIGEIGQQREPAMKPEQGVISRQPLFIPSLSPVNLLSSTFFCSSDLLSRSQPLEVFLPL
jgi:hypothetical protein